MIEVWRKIKKDKLGFYKNKKELIKNLNKKMKWGDNLTIKERSKNIKVAGIIDMLKGVDHPYKKKQLVDDLQKELDEFSPKDDDDIDKRYLKTLQLRLKWVKKL